MPSREERLAAFLSEQSGEPVTVTALDRFTEGHSRAMYRLETDAGDRFVVRVEQGGVFGTSSAEEFRVMAGLHAAGFPVAQVRWHEPTGEVLGQPFFVMDFIDGEEAQPDPSTAREFIRVLQQLHELDWRTLGIDFDIVPEGPAEATAAQIDRWEGVYRRSTSLAVPLLDEAASWLRHYAPPLQRISVVHGDAGPANFVHADGRVVAVTDFEFCHLGDPAEDWVFCAAMRGHRTMDREGWIEAFRDVAGFEIDAPTWQYWEAFNLFKGACANLTARRVFAEGVNPAPNMAIIGTALHQTFLRRLVDLTASAPA